MEPKVIVADLGCDYDGLSSDKLLAYDVSELPTGVVNEILQLFLKHHSKSLKNFLNENDYYEVNQIKQKEGWSVTDKDNLVVSLSDKNAIVGHIQKFDDKYLKSYIENGYTTPLRVFTEVSMPNSIQIRIDEISKKIEKEKQEKEIKKAQKRLERAKKILENNGKLP